MPQPETAIDIDALTDAIVASIGSAFPVFETVEAWRSTTMWPASLKSCLNGA